MSAIWESANWTRQTGNRQFGMLPVGQSNGGGGLLFSVVYSAFESIWD
jgi:hypothetical protein